MDASVEISLARPADALPISQMSRDLVETGLRWSWKPSRILTMINDPDCVVIIARTRFGLAGFAMMEFHDVHAHLNLLAVKPTQRRGGVGRALLTWLEQSAVVAGIASVHLEVRRDNTGAVRFYETLGYVAGRTLTGYYQGREDALKMTHHLIEPSLAAQRPH
ncbi:MAG: GNAT family N-acetyltransferase [Pseudomonadota bacterium]